MCSLLMLILEITFHLESWKEGWLWLRTEAITETTWVFGGWLSGARMPGLSQLCVFSASTVEMLLIAGVEGAAVAVECERGNNISASLKLIDMMLFENKNIISAASKHKCLK